MHDPFALPDRAAHCSLVRYQDIGALEDYIEASQRVLVFVSKGYFKSKSPRLQVEPRSHHAGEVVPLTQRILTLELSVVADCLREVRCTLAKQKPLSLCEDRVKGGASLDDIKQNECPHEMLHGVFAS